MIASMCAQESEKPPITDLDQLAKLWRERFPNRAGKGTATLLGFRFQLIVALRDAVRAYLEGEADGPTVFSERISDVCQRTSDGLIVFTQVKRVLRSVKTALEELWSIHLLAIEKKAELVPLLRYRILGSRSELKDIDRSISQWMSMEDVASEIIESFKRQVSWTTDPDPFDELLGLVANELTAKEPLQKVLSWIGLLSEGGDLRGIWSELHTLQTAKREEVLSGRLKLWTSEDRPPLSVMTGDVLINKQPSLRFFKGGYFADRPLYNKLTAEFMNWSKRILENDSDFRIPMFWLGGRSGCGKSVAMLHLLSRLHEERFATVIWLGSNVDLLPEAVRRAPWIARPGNQVVIAVDDPYSPRTQAGNREQWTKALAELEEQSVCKDQRPPILLCCGPTEQANRLRYDVQDEINLHIQTLPYKLADLEELKVWYQQRTGKPPPAVDSGDILLVQLFFEWRTGVPLRTFARSFRNRLEEFDSSRVLRDAVSKIIAVNRLYAGYPKDAHDSCLSPT